VIVETNSLTTISVGSQKSQTEPGDTALKIPNLILPSIELMEPTQITPLTSQIMQSSFVRSQYYARNNQAAGSAIFCTLGKGLWELDFRWNHRFLYAAAPAGANTNNYVQIVSPIGGISCFLAALLPTGAIANYVQGWRNRVLLRENAEIQIGYDVTGAADFLETLLMISAQKLL